MTRIIWAASAARYSFWWCAVRYLVLYLSVRQWLRAGIFLAVSVSLVWVVYASGWLVGLLAVVCFGMGFLGYFCIHSVVTEPEPEQPKKSFSDCLLSAVGVLTIVLCFGQLFVLGAWGYDSGSILWLFSRLALGLMVLTTLGWSVQLKWPYVWALVLPTLRSAAIAVVLGWEEVTKVWRGRRTA